VSTHLSQSRPRPSGRLAAHLALFAGFVVTSLVVVVWPLRLELDGAHRALTLAEERLQALDTRLDNLHRLNDRLRKWQTDERRVFLEDELDSVEPYLTRLVEEPGAQVLHFSFEPHRSPRWRELNIRDEAGAAAEAGLSEGEGLLRPVSVRLSLRGSFPAVFQAFAALTSQQRLLMVDRWQLRLTQQQTVQADVVATVFVIRPPASVPAFPTGGKLVHNVFSARNQG